MDCLPSRLTGAAKFFGAHKFIGSCMSIEELIPDEEWDAYLCISINRANLSRFVMDFANSIELFEFLERGGRPKSAGVLGGQFAKWRIIAARDGALNTYHFGCSLKAIQKQLPTCPTLNSRLNAIAIRNIVKEFKSSFPHCDTIRHAIAHAGECHKTPRKLKQNTDETGGFAFGSIHNRTYTIGFEGARFSVTMDTSALRKLSNIREAIEDEFAEAAKCTTP
jgi:hypothetical protein